MDTSVTWTRRLNQFFSIRPRVQFTQITTNVTPYFANRTNVSGAAGITGNNQDPVNWGPPSLAFSSITGLSDALPNYNRNQTLGGGAEAYFSRGRHNFTFGGDLKRNHVDILTQQNPRGGFSFTGKLTGSDVADFHARHSEHELDRLRQPGQVPPGVLVRRVYHGRHEAQPDLDGTGGRAMGV